MGSDVLTSVVIPFYGGFDMARLALAVGALKLQKDIQLEIVVATEIGVYVVPDCLPTAFEHAMSVDKGPCQAPAPGGLRVLRTGFLLNDAVAESTGDYVYVSDADIVMLDSQYLSRLLQMTLTSDSVTYRRPPMRRLLEQDFDSFLASVRTGGLDVTIAGLDLCQRYVARMDARVRAVRVFQKFESGRTKTFIASDRDFKTYVSSDSFKGQEPKFWMQEVHCGGTFMRRRQFDEVGGYCEEYGSWGCWDADLQWKLGAVGDMRSIPGDPAFEVMHLDHQRDYFSAEEWVKDRELQCARRRAGPAQCVEHDLRRAQRRTTHLKGLERLATLCPSLDNTGSIQESRHE